MHNRLLTILLRKLNIVRVREEWTPPCKAEEGVDVTPSTTDDNAAGRRPGKRKSRYLMTVVIVAALALSACLLAGCGENNKDSSNADAAKDTATQAAAEAQIGSDSSRNGSSSQSQSNTSEPDPPPASGGYELPVIPQ